MESWKQEMFLAHHGILGMRWGRRNGPPYPLSDADHSTSEKQAGWKKSLDPSSDAYKERKKKKKTGPVDTKYKDDESTAEDKKSEEKKEEPKQAHEDYNKAHDRKSVREMSDEELRRKLSRLNMEQQYSKLTGTDVSRAKKYFESTLTYAKKANEVMTTGLGIYNNTVQIRKIFGEKLGKEKS